MSKKRRYIAWAVAAAAVLVGGGVAAGASMATTVSRPAPKVYTGRAFDTCTAPSASAMKAWHNGFYGAAAVYVGGKNRGARSRT